MKKIVFKGFVSVILCLIFTCSTFAASADEVKQKIIAVANDMGVEPAIVLSIAKVESGFNQNAKSAGGHIGVFQLSGATAKSMGFNPYNLDENIKAGITYYKNMYNTFGSMELAVAAYNAGPYAIKRNNNTVPSKTKPFVSKIMKNYEIYKNAEL